MPFHSWPDSGNRKPPGQQGTQILKKYGSLIGMKIAVTLTTDRKQCSHIPTGKTYRHQGNRTDFHIAKQGLD